MRCSLADHKITNAAAIVKMAAVSLSIGLILLACVNPHAAANNLQYPQKIAKPEASGRFNSLNEPSGITALEDGTLLVINDESGSPLRRITINNASFDNFQISEYPQATADGFIKRRLIGPLDDLEGIAKLSSQRFFVIGSHENASRGRLPLREKLVLLTRDGANITSALMRQDLYEQLDLQVPDLTAVTEGSKRDDSSKINIEGLAYDRKRHRLLIGLRTPTIDNNAIIVALNNPVEYLEGAAPDFNNTLLTVDLDKQGIRAMAYDDLSDQLLLVGKRETGKKKHFSLWALNAQSLQDPVRYRSKSNKLFDNVEGLTPINGGIMFVRDEGDSRKKSTDHWFILTRTQLGLE